MRTRKCKKRQGRCYELAFSTLLLNSDWTLVHGRVNYDVGHAWLEKEGEVYDPVIDKQMSKETYLVEFFAEAQHEHNIIEAAGLLLKTNYYGPWTEGEIASTEGGSIQQQVIPL
jgi:hypothetical protein